MIVREIINMDREDYRKLNQLLMEGGFFGIQLSQNTPQKQGVSVSKNSDPRKADFFKDLSSGPGSTPQVDTPRNENEENVEDTYIVKAEEVEKIIQSRITFIEESCPDLKPLVEHLRAIEKDVLNKAFKLPRN